jgi:hypothetical protein
VVAEVLDKAELPWAASSIVAAALVASVCAMLPRIPALAARVAGAAIAVGWGALRIAFDPWCDPALGSHLRHELGDPAALGYVAAMLGCALLPIAAFGISAARK